MPKKEKQQLPDKKMSITSMSGLIHTDIPDLYWQNEQTGELELCRKKLIYAEELYQALGLAPSQRARSIAKWKEHGFENVDWNEREIETGRKKTKLQSAYLRVEFAKKICMQINTPIADAVRDYLIKETAAFWASAKRQAIATVTPDTQIPLSDAVRKVVEKAIKDAVSIAIQENNQRNAEASRVLYNQNFALLEDLKNEHVDDRNKTNLRAHISNMVRKHCYETGTSYKLFWDKCYNSFKIRHKSCDWYWAFCQAKNQVEFIAENLPIKYLQEFQQIVISFILESK